MDHYLKQIDSGLEEARILFDLMSDNPAKADVLKLNSTIQRLHCLTQELSNRFKGYPPARSDLPASR